jgi:hypothetical protein
MATELLGGRRAWAQPNRADGTLAVNPLPENLSQTGPSVMKSVECCKYLHQGAEFFNFFRSNT